MLGVGTHFPRKCFKNIDFYTVWEPLGIQKRMKRMKRMCRMKAKRYTTGTSEPRFSAPEARMIVVNQPPQRSYLNYYRDVVRKILSVCLAWIMRNLAQHCAHLTQCCAQLA